MNTIKLDQCPGQILSNCRVEQLLSRGSIGAVYRALQLDTRRTVALTLFLLPETTPSAIHEQFCERAQNQARALMKLEHPHLLPYYGYGEWEGLPYLITPYTAEGSLATLIKQRGSWSAAEVLPILEQVTGSLDYAHRHGQVHGMLTPANLLLSNDGTFQVSGLGLQHVLERRGILPCTKPAEHLATLAGIPLCAAKYLAPEYRQGQSVTNHSDVYSLGVILVELLSGSLLPAEITAQEILRRIEQVLPTDWLPILQQALAQDPTRRFPRITDLFSHATKPGRYVEGREKREQQRYTSLAPLSPAPVTVNIRNQEAAYQDSANEREIEATFQKRWALSERPLRLSDPTLSSPDSSSMRSATINSTANSTAINNTTRQIQQKIQKNIKEIDLPRRQVTALLAGGAVIGLAGVGGLTLLQKMFAGGKANPAGAAPVANGAGQVTQAVNSAIQLIDAKAPEHRQRLLIHLASGNFVAYKQGCTHAGVLVNYDPKTQTLICPAHGAIFDAKNGSVLAGPTTIPLPAVAIKIGNDGTISLL